MATGSAKYIHKNIPECPHCGNIHRYTCAQYSELWDCLSRLRLLLTRIYYNSTSYPDHMERFPIILKDIEKLLGEISGFPECCCEAYANGKSGKDMDSRIDSNYVLCDRCEDALIKEFDDREYLNSRL